MNYYRDELREKTIFREIKGEKILDIGCRDGIITKQLPCNEIIGIDIDLPKIRDIPSNCSFLKANALDLPFKDETFDCVLLSEVLEHIEDHKKVLKEAHRVLKIGGRVVVTVPNSTVLGIKQKSSFMDKTHVREYTPRELNTLFSNFFSVHKIEGIAFPRKLIMFKPLTGVFDWTARLLPFLGIWILIVGIKNDKK